MKSEKLGVVRGSGNVFRDLGNKNADAEQVKAILTAEIKRRFKRDGLSIRSAQGRTGIAAADFSRIRNANLGRFTVDRLMSIINRLGSRLEVKIKVRRAQRVAEGVPTSRLASGPAVRDDFVPQMSRNQVQVRATKGTALGAFRGLIFFRCCNGLTL
jgi:predicted XRE-type DNA-binding protein